MKPRDSPHRCFRKPQAVDVPEASDFAFAASGRHAYASGRWCERSGDFNARYRALDMRRSTRIAVIGAGLGGMTVAGLLQRRGFPVKVYEQAPAFSRIGAGIHLSSDV